MARRTFPDKIRVDDGYEIPRYCDARRWRSWVAEDCTFIRAKRNLCCRNSWPRSVDYRLLREPVRPTREISTRLDYTRVPIERLRLIGRSSSVKRKSSSVNGQSSVRRRVVFRSRRHGLPFPFIYLNAATTIHSVGRSKLIKLFYPFIYVPPRSSTRERSISGEEQREILAGRNPLENRGPDHVLTGLRELSSVHEMSAMIGSDVELERGTLLSKPPFIPPVQG